MGFYIWRAMINLTELQQFFIYFLLSGTKLSPIHCTRENFIYFPTKFLTSSQIHCTFILQSIIPNYIKRSILCLHGFYFRTYMELKEPGGTLINILTTIISIENMAVEWMNLQDKSRTLVEERVVKMDKYS